MFKINLVPEAKLLQKKIQRLNLTTTFIAIGVLGFIVFIIILLVAIKVSYITSRNKFESQIKATQEEIDNNYKEIEEAVISLDNGLVKIDELMKGNNKWSVFIKELEKITPKDVSFKKLKIDGNKVTADLEGKNVDSLARFIDSFSNHKVKKAGENESVEINLFENTEVDGYKRNENGGIDFSVTMDLKKEALNGK